MKNSILFLTMAFFIGLISCVLKERLKHDKNTFYNVKYLDNYDGDTITVTIPDVHPLLGEKISVRIIGIDTPELKTQNKCEREKGYQAKEEVALLLKNAHHIHIQNIERDKYFRILGNVIADGESLSEILLKKKLAYRYDGGKKSIIDWCRN